ncbi:methyltransferase family protein [Kitasatospora sp. SolWspMP-SS2h]|uniref:class I SAM-dependent methyltransferase n=1 Tax=Kitasatospora sp. SolWspMP-SS2h TaxID=1305729 RepID=UPI000DB9D2BF|nr:class I SAM-dependent methyltransferase [Kitasatospora sp. SolWspMP-SS2h]RAJ45634.1 methyltransferase family protein [Kitasatospora sp. SolWspMP-SS2h]
MVEGWKWDDTLFAGAAPYYARGRLPYAPGLADALAGALRLDGTGRLLDVGCGPGTLALGLADRFAETVGLDADAAMVAEAARSAARAGLAGRTRWVHARAEQLPYGLGTFDIIAFAQSFHWMDREPVAATARDMLRPGGTLVHLADWKSEPLPADPAPLPYPPVPQPAIDALVRRHLGPVRRAGRGVLPHGTPGGESRVYARAGLLGPERLVVPGGQALERDADQVVAGVLSLSSSAPHLFGTGLPAFEAELRALLREFSPSGRFSVRQPGSEAVLWRRPGG